MRSMLKKMLKLVLSPVVIFVWLIGWTLYFFGSNRSSGNLRKSQNATANNSLEIAAVINEELLIATEES
ncbi:hypothetical protein KEJ15_06235 [Candidatus Bathyarchaeota archaeon]|nr:hypothetical protein [Candidatus Bathyarchaeota archaeon]